MLQPQRSLNRPPARQQQPGPPQGLHQHVRGVTGRQATGSAPEAAFQAGGDADALIQGVMNAQSLAEAQEIALLSLGSAHSVSNPCPPGVEADAGALAGAGEVIGTGLVTRAGTDTSVGKGAAADSELAAGAATGKGAENGVGAAGDAPSDNGDDDDGGDDGGGLDEAATSDAAHGCFQNWVDGSLLGCCDDDCASIQDLQAAKLECTNTAICAGLVSLIKGTGYIFFAPLFASCSTLAHAPCIRR